MMDVENTFKYHAPKGNQAERYQIIREAAKTFVKVAVANSPASREQAVGLTNVQQAVMWLNASIAINENEVSA